METAWTLAQGQPRRVCTVNGILAKHRQRFFSHGTSGQSTIPASRSHPRCLPALVLCEHASTLWRGIHRHRRRISRGKGSQLENGHRWSGLEKRPVGANAIRRILVHACPPNFHAFAHRRPNRSVGFGVAKRQDHGHANPLACSIHRLTEEGAEGRLSIQRRGSHHGRGGLHGGRVPRRRGRGVSR